jgi:hypothetical protein
MLDWVTIRTPYPRVVLRWPFPCGARTRSGKRCRAWPVLGMRRCRMHGGRSTGPRTSEGRARIAESNRRRAERRPKQR